MIVSPDPCTPISALQWRMLRELWPNAQRLDVAWRLALDLRALEDLLAGGPIDPSRLDPDELEHAKQARLVELRRPIDVLGFGAAAA